MAEVVLVVGAGGGVSFGFPTGPQLATDIADRLTLHADRLRTIPTGDQDLLDELRRQGGPAYQSFIEVAEEVATSITLFRSVDDCLDSRSGTEGFVEAGKIGIARAIHLKEMHSPLLALDYPHQDDYPAAVAALKKSWVAQLFALLTPGVREPSIEQLFSRLVPVLPYKARLWRR